MRALFLFLGLSLFISLKAFSFDPVTVDGNTIGLWNFNGEIDDQVYDQGIYGLSGTALSAAVVMGIPDLDVLFLEAREITGDGFIDLGQVNSSALELTGATQASVEALIHLTQNADGQHIIFSTDQVELMVINNYLAAFIRQTGGKFGVVSETLLELNTTYRVNASFGSGKLGIFVNGRNQGVVAMAEAIAPIPIVSGFQPHGFIGGNMFSQSFPGYIDDVRFSNVQRGDILSPTIGVVSPATGVVHEARPVFTFDLSDNDSGVDVNSVKVYLNNVLQTSLSITSTAITGQMDSDFSSSSVNEVKVYFTDNVGNETEKSFYYTFSNITARTEYMTDEYTLGLWHMNDFAPEIMLDSSGHGADGFGLTGDVAVGDGVFSKGRYFAGNGESKISLKSTLIPGNQFSLEAWVMPATDNVDPNQQEYIFDNGQIRIARYNGGHIRITFLQARDSRIFESAIPFLPVGELHHMAITWDGSKEVENLLIYIDSGIMQKFNAPFYCDFAPMPVVGIVGKYFNGMIDEMRFSSIVRDGFNIPTFETRIIDFLTLTDGSSTDSNFPVLQVSFNSDTIINPANVKVILNDVVQPATADLIITGTSINGTMLDEVNPGLNIIEVEFIDNNGNQKKRKQYFYYIKKNVGQPYVTDANTIGLWHFSFDASDSSGNGYDLYQMTDSTISIKDDGKIGKAISGYSTTEQNSVIINSKEFTVEGWFKQNNALPSDTFKTIIYLNSAEFTLNIDVDFFTGDVKVYYYHPDFNLNQTIPGAFPTDGNYHHVALIYNGCHSFSQMILTIDGIVKKSFNAPSYCRVLNPLSFALAYYQEAGNLLYDEVRLSDKARYDFNIGDMVKPTKVSFSPDKEETIHDPLQMVNLVVTSPSGISSDKTFLLLNGIVETGVNFSQSGLQGTFSGTFENIIPGANLIQIFANDNNNNTQEFIYTFYMFNDGGVGEYTEDANTLGLWHMNENSGTIMGDSSGNGYDFDMSMFSWIWNFGVFQTSGVSVNNHIGLVNIPVIENLASFTIEGWFKGTSGNYGTPMFSFYSGYSLLTRGDYYITPHTITLFRPTNYSGSGIFSKEILLTDGFHHIAIVADKDHPYQNYYLLVDGKVLYSGKLSLEELTLNQDGSFQIGGNNDIDEVRFSDVSRYELKYKQAK